MCGGGQWSVVIGPSARQGRMDRTGPAPAMAAWPEPRTAPQQGCSCRCMGDAIHDFTQHSSLHGLRYIHDPTITRAERFFWVVSFVMACGFATNFIMNIYSKWANNPVIMSLSPEPTLLSTIPFPAITICNMNNARKSIATDILERARYSGSGGSKERKMLNDYCNFPQEQDDVNVDESDIDWDDLRAFMVNVTQPCHEMLVSCYWHSERYRCDDLFNPTLTDEGICCSFNRVKRDLIFHNPKGLSDLNITFPFESIDWSPEQGFPPGTPVDLLPWRPWGAGSHLGLTLVLNADLDESYCSSEVSIGFKVVLHNPVETPKMSAFASLVEPGMETRIITEPVIMTTTQQFQQIAAHKRNCVFANEKNLSFYRTYTQRNCALECEAKFTLDACKCVLYYMPKNDTTRICSRNDQDCAARALKAMELRMVDDDNISASLNTSQTSSCGCKPGCFALNYKIQLSTSQLSSKSTIGREYDAGKGSIYFSKNMAVLHTFFADSRFTANQRGELFGFTELLSNTGGLLGLFMGFSFLSAIEGIYFLTLRLWCASHRRKDKPIVVISNIVKDKTPFPFTQ